MIFIERKKQDRGYTYELKEIFGEVQIDSTLRLDKEKLDQIIAALIAQNTPRDRVEGTVEIGEDETITYIFNRKPQWGGEDEEICDVTPTDTKQPESIYKRIRRLITRTTYWWQAFTEAYREACKKTCKETYKK